MGTKLKTVKREGVDVVFALDVSKSMLAEDIAPNRLEKAKQIISKIIDKLGSIELELLFTQVIRILFYPLQQIMQLQKCFYKMQIQIWFLAKEQHIMKP